MDHPFRRAGRFGEHCHSPDDAVNHRNLRQHDGSGAISIVHAPGALPERLY
ncbi:MAG: hypothetical protein K2Y71_26245 [Xanthobacteraceae bacterium]|nr:hypothetical protein [Xanthobacteraceae bacterium]